MSNPQLSTARALLRSGNPAGALAELNKVFAEDPDSVAGGLLAAQAYLDQRKFEDAETTVLGVLKTDAENVEALTLLANSYSWRNKYKAGLPIAEQIIQLDPDGPMGYVQRAIFLEQKGKYRPAEADYSHALELDPHGLTNVRALYADFLMNRGRMDEARRLTDELTAEDAGGIEAAILRAEIALRENRIEDARQDVLWALSQNPENVHALYVLGGIKMKTSPLMGLWFRYATWIGRFTTWQRWTIIIGMIFAVRILGSIAGPFSSIIALLWLVFCATTWIGPGMLKRMVERELKAVQIKPF